METITWKQRRQLAAGGDLLFQLYMRTCKIELGIDGLTLFITHFDAADAICFIKPYTPLLCRRVREYFPEVEIVLMGPGLDSRIFASEIDIDWILANIDKWDTSR